jgi:hypothetical protein
MKTAMQTTQEFPRPVRFSLYMCAVAILCFFNWVALNAQSVPFADNTDSHLARVLAEENEPDLPLQDWMMDLETGYLAAAVEPVLSVEPWMLSFNHDYMAETGDSEISFQPWMVNFEQRCLVVDAEQEYSVECWMVSTCTWDCGNKLLAKK